MAGQVIRENVNEATCISGGSYDEVIKCYVCGEIMSSVHKTVPVDPNNHTGKQKLVGEKAAGCETEGYSGDILCGDCGQLLAVGIKYEPIGHIYGPPVYTWASDMKSCTAEEVCINDNTHIIKETVEVKKCCKDRVDSGRQGCNNLYSCIHHPGICHAGNGC